MIKKTSVAVMLILAFCPTVSCNRANTVSGEKFGAVSHKSEWIEFTNAEFGEINLTAANEEKLFDLDEKGSLSYFTGDVVSGYVHTDSIVVGKGRTTVALRFVPGKIDKGDFVMLRAAVALPEKIKRNGKEITELDAMYKYDYRHAGRVEYIWFTFDDKNSFMHQPGKWSLSVYSGDMRVYSCVFNVK